MILAQLGSLFIYLFIYLFIFMFFNHTQKLHVQAYNTTVCVTYIHACKITERICLQENAEVKAFNSKLHYKNIVF